MKRALVFALLMTTPAQAGAISKFDQRQPAADYESTKSTDDIARCLIDLDGQGAPIVYRFDDRPDDVTLVWQRGEAPGIIGYRVDLHREGARTHVRSWMPVKQVIDCAPR